MCIAIVRKPAGAYFSRHSATRGKFETYIHETPRLGTASGRILANLVVPMMARDPRFARLSGTPAIVARLKRALTEAVNRLGTYHDKHAEKLRGVLDDIEKELAS